MFVERNANGDSGAVAPRRLEEVERADGVDVEVVERPARGEVVRRLRGGVDDQLGLRLLDDAFDAGAVADVEVVVLESLRGTAQPLEVPRRVAVLAEEVPAHVVVDAVHGPAARVEEGDHLRADQPARACDKGFLHPAELSQGTT